MQARSVNQLNACRNNNAIDKQERSELNREFIKIHRNDTVKKLIWQEKLNRQ